MDAMEANVILAAQMYRCRSAAKTILGDKFKQKMDEMAAVIRAVMARDKCNCIVAGSTAIKESELHGMSALIVMAAVVEMVEPSTHAAIKRSDK